MKYINLPDSELEAITQSKGLINGYPYRIIRPLGGSEAIAYIRVHQEHPLYAHSYTDVSKSFKEKTPYTSLSFGDVDNNGNWWFGFSNFGDERVDLDAAITKFAGYCKEIASQGFFEPPEKDAWPYGADYSAYVTNGLGNPMESTCCPSEEYTRQEWESFSDDKKELIANEVAKEVMLEYVDIWIGDLLPPGE